MTAWAREVRRETADVPGAASTAGVFTPPPLAPRPARGGTAPHLLLVDDDPAQLELLAAFLERDGYHLACALGGCAALTLVADRLPDLILMDVRMPDMDGFGVIRRLKSEAWTADTPVVMMTSADGRDDRLTALDLGAEDLLRKPVDAAELRARVRSLLRGRHHRQAREQAEGALILMARAVDARDPYLHGHLDRTARLVTQLAHAFSLTRAETSALQLAAYLHDIGNVAVPESVLLKPGALTDGERAVVRSHSAAGEALLRPLQPLDGVRLLVRHHHERLDGSGYPDGLRAGQVSVSARILSAADAFDVLTARRPFRDAHSLQAALAILGQEVASGERDPEVIRRLTQIVTHDAAVPVPPSDGLGCDLPEWLPSLAAGTAGPVALPPGTETVGPRLR